MKEILNSYSFHDTFIISFECRTIEDYFDYCTFTLKSDDFIEIFGSKVIKLVFKGVYKIISNIQMWICGNDSIREFLIVDDSDELKQIVNLKTKGFLPNVEYTHFKIIFNTSSSVIEIIAEDFSIELLK